MITANNLGLYSSWLYPKSCHIPILSTGVILLKVCQRWHTECSNANFLITCWLFNIKLIHQVLFKSIDDFMCDVDEGLAFFRRC